MYPRKRSFSHQQPLSTSSTQNAQSAASHAFLRSQPSSGSLSSAAAAAALRNSPSPSPVENLQTKRVLQRRASLSQANMPRSPSRSGPCRSSSSASMTERTFREQSPRRPATSSGPADVPPLPAIPPEYAMRRGTSRRSLSVDAPIRPSSTPPRSPSTRGVSVDRMTKLGPPQSSRRIQGLSTVPEDERSASRASVNFSYPTSPGPKPPSPRSVTFAGRDISTPPPPTREWRSTEAADARRSVPQSGRKPATQRSRGFSGGEEGHVSTAGGGSGYPVGTAVAAAQTASLQKDDATPDHSQLRIARSTKVDGQAAGQAAMQMDHRPCHAPTAREPDDSGQRAQTAPPATDIDQEPDSGRLSNGNATKLKEHTKTIHSLAPSEEPPTVTVAPMSDESSPSQGISVENRSPPERECESRQPYRPQSASPPRSTRFSNNLSVAGTKQVHQPPPRSVSPVKPALKQQPKDSLSPSRPAQAACEMSDGTSVGTDDGSRLGFKRKPVRVSFDDEAEIAGVAASPPTSPESGLPESPGKSRSKANWYGAGKKKPPQSDDFGDDELGDVLKPRPALPSFGSIRDSRESQQRKPVEAELSENESTASASSDEIVTSLPFSSDHALGGLLHHTPSETDQQRIESDHPTPSNANDGRHTSILGENLPASEADARTFRAGSTPPPVVSTNGTSHPDPSTVTAEPLSTDIEKGKSSLELFHVPGGFPRASMELNPRTSKKRTKSSGKGSNSDGTALGGSETPKPNGTDDESDESIYSDAAEDLEGDGFGSINAIMSGESFEPSKPTGAMVNGDQSVKSSSETKQYGRSMSPVQESGIQSPPDSPIYSPQPPLPPKSKLRAAGPSAKAPKRTMSVAAHGSRRDGAVTNGILPQKAESDTLELRLKPNQGRSRRPMSVGPVLPGDKDTSHDDERLEHVKGFLSQTAGTPSAPRLMLNGGDPSSSFKRSNRPTKGSPVPSMKRALGSTFPTLRGQSSMDTAASLEEQRSQWPTSSGAFPGKMPMTLRAGNMGGKASYFSTGKTPKRSPKSGGLFKQRFTDSDDDDASIRHQGFRSRFPDSSDDEDPVTRSLSPVRGIPRRQGWYDGDSTELEDSSEDEGRPPRPVMARKPVATTDNPGLDAVARSRGITREQLDEFLHRPPRGQKPGLLRRLSIMKPKDPDGRLNKSILDSPSSRDAALEDPRAKRNQAQEKPTLDGHGEPNVVTTISSNNHHPPSSPRPNKRGIKKYTMTDNWSLNSKPRETGSPEPVAEPRARNLSPVYEPQTSDAQKRNTLGAVQAPRREADADLLQVPQRSTSALDVVIAPTGRRKRFPSLRKAFGLRS
ncbi:hypothetical protein PHISP_06397 [Aspergillus sp. HF37]|nr:hypothetical protein PHISP_06397 [Aspergillus sp. HF37]